MALNTTGILNEPAEQDAGEGFVPKKLRYAIVVLAAVGMLWNTLPYNNTLSILLQGFLLGAVFLVFRETPVMFIVSVIMLVLLPAKYYGGFVGVEGMSCYAVNAQAASVAVLLYYVYGLLFRKERSGFGVTLLIFIVYLVITYAGSITKSNYNMEFIWFCLAYTLIPRFVKSDTDVRVVCLAYIVSVDAFIIGVTPVLASRNLYRGIVNLNPNYASFYVLISITLILILLTFYKDMSGKMKAFLYASLLASVLTSAEFASRAAFTFLAMLALMYFFFNIRNPRTLIISLLAIVVLLVVFGRFQVFQEVIERFSEPDVEGGGNRLQLIRTMLAVVRNSKPYRLLFGYGFLSASQFSAAQAHNTYTSILVGFGVLGFLLYMAYLLKIYITVRRSEHAPFLYLFYFLAAYGFALEPYHLLEGIVFFAVLDGIGRFSPPRTLRPAHGRLQVREAAG